MDKTAENVPEARFTVTGPPMGKGRPRFNTKTGHAITPAKTANYEALVQWEYARQCGDFKFDGAAMLDLRVAAYYALPKSDSKKIRAMKIGGIIRPTKVPDTDNIIKIVADSLNGIAYRDDAQIVDCQCRKFYSENPRVEVAIRKI